MATKQNIPKTTIFNYFCLREPLFCIYTVCTVTEDTLTGRQTNKLVPLKVIGYPDFWKCNFPINHNVCLSVCPKSVRKMFEKIISLQNAIFTYFIIFHHATLMRPPYFCRICNINIRFFCYALFILLVIKIIYFYLLPLEHAHLLKRKQIGHIKTLNKPRLGV